MFWQRRTFSSTTKSSSSTSFQPQTFEIGESSQKSTIERHEEQILDILNSLDAIPIEKWNREGASDKGTNASKRPSTTEAPAMTQDAIRKLVADSVTLALEAQAATMASASNPDRNTNPTGTPAVKTGNYKEFISCQPFYFNEYQEINVLCPNMVPNNDKLLEAFIGGLPQSIEGNVTASKPQTLEEAINIAQRLMDQVTKHAPISKHFSPSDRIALVLDRSFISISLASKLKIPSITIDTFYDIEMADGNLVSTNTVIKGCTLTLLNQPFEIDLMPIKLGSFDVVIVMEKKSDEKRLEDILIVKEFPDVFPEDLPGVPPVLPSRIPN
ncbi:hypothetical protein Tco_0975266 [Tanacetum coccineum]|uniref:Reverse transcriptase domain-containing protein n=1 Tax=Tanacetum coccineum TaxID=301880 RepID=A0ABQ5EDW6_9ASTR